MQSATNNHEPGPSVHRSVSCRSARQNQRHASMTGEQRGTLQQQKIKEYAKDKGVQAQVAIHRKLAASRNPLHKRGKTFNLPAPSLKCHESRGNGELGPFQNIQPSITSSTPASTSYAVAARRSDGAFDPGREFGLLSMRRLALYEHCAVNLQDPHAATKLGDQCLSVYIQPPTPFHLPIIRT